MGFAKYQEDNFSRYYAASIVRGREHDPFVAKGGGAEETKDTKKMEDKASKLKCCRLPDSAQIWRR